MKEATDNPGFSIDPSSLILHLSSTPNRAIMIRQTPNSWIRSPMDRAPRHKGEKFLLWVDAVGGYWVCLGDEVVLGQPVTGGTVDVPILGDLSARHARIRRDGEGYMIEALRDVSIDGRRVAQMALLADGSKIQLGTGVRLVFRRPHGLSATARLDFASHHRTQPSVDAVLLMADSLVLGPHPHSHVVCRDWPEEVVLYRHEDQLYCRTRGRMEIDGLPCQGRGMIHPDAHIVGAHFAMSLEAI
jgi:hypothetical protein